MSEILGKKRDDSLDFVAGLLMLVVIFHHAGVLVSKPLSLMHFFNFFMPWFFFKAGLFHKEETKMNVDFFRKMFKRFFFPLCTCLLTSALIRYKGLGFSLDENIFVHLSNSNPAVWFIFAMVFARSIFVIIPKKTVFIVGTIVLSFLFADIINCENLSIPVLVKEIPMALFYYSCGFFCRNFSVEKWSEIFFLGFVYLLYIVLIPSKIDMRMEYVMFGKYEIAVIGNIVGILMINAFAKKVVRYSPRPIIFIGKESMVYYILHVQILVESGLLIEKFGLQAARGYISALIVLILIPLIIKLFDRFKLNVLLGK